MRSNYGKIEPKKKERELKIDSESSSVNYLSDSIL